MSLYQGRAATPGEVATAMARLKTAFPRMDGMFFSLLAERLIDNGFTAERTRDAVNNVLDGFQYKELTIADIIRYDRRVRLYSYNEVCVMVSGGKAAFSDFEIKEIDGKCYRVRKSDLA